MSVFKVAKCANCILQRGISTIRLQNRTLTTFAPDYSKGDSNTDRGTVQDTSKILSNILGSCNSGSIFTGTGQYHQTKDQDRLLVLNFHENFLTETNVTLFDTKVVLDCSIKHSDIDSLIEAVQLNSTLPVYNGEMDFINSSPWQYGITLKPFSIFSADERICFISGNSIYMSKHGVSEVIDVNDIDYVGISVSEEPYNEQRLLFGMKNGLTKTLVSVERNNVSCDLAKLTVETEWMTKTAALLCANVREQTNKKVPLSVSPVLLPGNNEWVAMRQKIWLEMIVKNTREDDDI